MTVVALLSLELLLIGGLAAFLYSPAPPYLISQWLAGNVSPPLEPYLAQDPPDLEGLRTTLREVGGDVGGGEESTDPADLEPVRVGPRPAAASREFRGARTLSSEEISRPTAFPA